MPTVRIGFLKETEGVEDLDARRFDCILIPTGNETLVVFRHEGEVPELVGYLFGEEAVVSENYKGYPAFRSKKSIEEIRKRLGNQD